MALFVPTEFQARHTRLYSACARKDFPGKCVRSRQGNRFGAFFSLHSRAEGFKAARREWSSLAIKRSYQSVMNLTLPLLLLSSSPGALAAPNPTQSSQAAQEVIASTMATATIPEQSSQAAPQCENLCEESYGFLPCSSNIGGNLFLMATFGCLLLVAARFISKGSEVLLEVMNPGLIGGLLLPILGALPDTLLILASGTGGSIQEAQEEVMVGVGVLAGSTTLLLTLAWAGSLLAGRCDLSSSDRTAKDEVLTKKYDLFHTGVTVDTQTRWGAWIMIASTLPLICAQVPLLDGHPSEGPEAAFIGSAISCVGLFVYCAYQVAFPWLQQKRIDEARLGFLKTRVLQKVSSYSSIESKEKKLAAFGREKLENIFICFDKNADGKIEKDELEAFMVGLGIETNGDAMSRDLIDNWLKEFDVDANKSIAQHEFVEGLNKWAVQVAKVKHLRALHQLETSDEPNFWAAKSEEAEKVLRLLEQDIDEVEDDKSQPGSSKLYVEAILYLLSGSLLAAAFADPLVNSINGFAQASQIPPFFIAFVFTPLASNASELVSSISFAQKRRKRNISLTFSQIYGAVTMNNTLCLGIFLGLVYTRGLTWDFSSEVTAILITTFFVGVLGGSRMTFPSWLSLPVLVLYPLSIASIAFLDNVLGWH
ncbi:sodium/calcium exchanger NCL2 isoform X1 [Selaginella moellendorffii]|nr:sodium/calcium exchanger NCL2 isoform X1 [Selaginella moellendorffii]|eukprot:XP_002985423.2 sodium/calcium exchanger NCL2 isoform X1 [Selaginella moellendorffii]